MLARLAGDSRVETVSLMEVQPLTGYQRGGVTALGCQRDHPVYLDETVILDDRISAFAGMRGLQIVLHPEDNVRATKATVGPIAREKG